MKRILCAGIAVADIPILPVSPSAFERDSSDIEPLRILTGGDALNEAIVLRRLGVDCALSACVGSDIWGECILSTLKAEGVDTRFVTRLTDCPTTTSVILIEPDGERHFLLSHGALDRFTLRPDPAMKEFDIISIGSLWGMPNLTLDALAAVSAFARITFDSLRILRRTWRSRAWIISTRRWGWWTMFFRVSTRRRPLPASASPKRCCARWRATGRSAWC